MSLECEPTELDATDGGTSLAVSNRSKTASSAPSGPSRRPLEPGDQREIRNIAEFLRAL